jgi:hypothetical protein
MLNQVRRFSVADFLLLFIFSLANNAAAHVHRGSVVGAVVDASAASAAAAKVTVTNLETNQAVEPIRQPSPCPVMHRTVADENLGQL